MANYTGFKRATGEIVSNWWSTETGMVEINSSGEIGQISGTYDGSTHYVQNDQAIPRPASPVTLNGLTLENLPIPAKVLIDKTEYDTDAAEVELDFPLPGNYKIRVVAFPHLDWTGEVTV